MMSSMVVVLSLGANRRGGVTVAVVVVAPAVRLRSGRGRGSVVAVSMRLGVRRRGGDMTVAVMMVRRRQPRSAAQQHRQGQDGGEDKFGGVFHSRTPVGLSRVTTGRVAFADVTTPWE